MLPSKADPNAFAVKFRAGVATWISRRTAGLPACSAVLPDIHVGGPNVAVALRGNFPRRCRATPPAPTEPTAGDERRPKPPKAGKGGSHTFRDLVGSDHAEIQLLAADGDIALHFTLDYLSESPGATSGYASLGVSGGEGKVFVGEPAWVLGSTTSMDRNLNACGLGGYVTDSPGSDVSYAASPSAPDWDYRVIYEVWVSTEAFGSAGFGSALIESVHASPSKAGENTQTVLPAPCPPTPGAPESPPWPVPPVLTEIR